jgi:hypothetical protein
MRQEFDSLYPHSLVIISVFFTVIEKGGGCLGLYVDQNVDNYVYMCIKDIFQHDLYLNKIV